MSIAPGIDAASAAPMSEPPTLNDFLMPEPGGGAGDHEEDDLSALIADEDLPADDGLSGSDDDDGVDDPGDPDAGDDRPAEPAVPLPSSWSKEDAKAWADLTPEAQAIVARREGERDKYVRKAGYEAAQTRQQVESQARDIFAQMQEQHAAALMVYASQFYAEEPDQRLLYTGNPDDVLLYQRQDAAYRASATQQHELQQAIAQAQAAAGSARNQTQQADLVSDAQRLREQLPEWFDPSAGHGLKVNLQSIGAELGYPDELMAAASSTDILALKKAAEWKADAEKYRKLQARKMEAVRAAKGMPRMAKPGMRPTRGQQEASTTNRRADALQSFGHTRSGEAAAALLLERKR